jgi:DNA-directed RNA polymerase subunit RPC12/RpoP
MNFDSDAPMIRESKKEKFKTRLARRGSILTYETGFQCIACGRWVTTSLLQSGVRNRNHCPHCLHSRHLDHLKPGDRMSACKSDMQPVALVWKQTLKKYTTQENSELMLLHHCPHCGKFSLNRLAADDDTHAIWDVFFASLSLDQSLRRRCSDNGITPLGERDLPRLAVQLPELQMVISADGWD